MYVVAFVTPKGYTRQEHIARITEFRTTGKDMLYEKPVLTSKSFHIFL
jgi:hypothetical protein